GSTEAHFHFFVMITMLASYEEWMPYLLALGFVVLHHGLTGVLDPRGVYDHSDAVHNPWKWALIHAAFVLALSAVNIVSWRLNEDARALTRQREEDFRGAFENAPIGMAIVGLDGRIVRANEALAEITGIELAQLPGTASRSIIDERGADQLSTANDDQAA